MEKDGGHGSLPKMVEIDGAINENKFGFQSCCDRSKGSFLFGLKTDKGREPHDHKSQL